MLVINDKDRVSKLTKDYFINNYLHTKDPERNPEKYIVRVSRLKLDCVLALYKQKKIIVTDTKDYDKHTDLGFICFWYDDFDDINQRTVFLDMAYVDLEVGSPLNGLGLIHQHYSIIYDALVKEKIIFEV